MFAESNIVSPASRQMSTSRVAPSALFAPQALKNSLLPPPNVPVPRLRTGTISPEAPNCRCSIRRFPIPNFQFPIPRNSQLGLEVGSWKSGVDAVLFVDRDRLVFGLEIRHLR